MDAIRIARIGGWVAVWAGLLGFAAAGFLLLVPPAVPAAEFNYPLSHELFTVIQVVFFVHHLAMAFAMWALWRAGLAGRGRLANAGGLGAVCALALLGCWELVAISGAGRTYPSTETDWLDTGYGVLTLSAGVALVALGVAVIRSRMLAGPGRWSVLVAGAYVFVPMVPALFAGFVLGRLALAVWLLLFGVIGVAMVRWSAVPTNAGPTAERPSRTQGAPA